MPPEEPSRGGMETQDSSSPLPWTPRCYSSCITHGLMWDSCKPLGKALGKQKYPQIAQNLLETVEFSPHLQTGAKARTRPWSLNCGSWWQLDLSSRFFSIWYSQSFPHWLVGALGNQMAEPWKGLRDNNSWHLLNAYYARILTCAISAPL